MGDVGADTEQSGGSEAPRGSCYPFDIHPLLPAAHLPRPAAPNFWILAPTAKRPPVPWMAVPAMRGWSPRRSAEAGCCEPAP